MMIQVERLTKYFGPVVAVDDVSFEIDKGTIVGFLGHNGAGKTTTMRILTTYLPATSGIARVAGFDVMRQSMDVRKNIGYLPDSVPLYGEMRVEEYLEFRGKLKGVDRKTRPQRIEYCLERCRIREVRRRLLGTLSRGYRQRVGLADAMIHDPAVLILDEPTAGLDIKQQDETLGLIKELGQSHTVIFSTHRMTEVEAICSQVVLIAKGRLKLHRKLKDLEADAPIVLEVRGPRDQVEKQIKHVEGVTRVTHQAADGEVHQFQVQTKNSKDLREALAKHLVGQGYGVRRLERKANLHSYFEDMMGERTPSVLPPAETPASLTQPSESIKP